jgi:glutathione peroxidase
MGIIGLLALATGVGPVFGQDKEGKKVPPVLSFTMDSLAGKPVELARYQGKVVLIVNVASECGYTPQYKGLQALHQKYAKEGLAVLGFPCNDFGGQEPGTSADIARFCQKNYGVEFDLFAKITVQGKDAAPLYRHLTSKDANPKFAGPISWNFEKFLINRRGEVVARFKPETEPDAKEVIEAIETELKKK